MIKRYYFYHAQTETINSQFCYGVISTRSWFACPGEAISQVAKDIEANTGATASKIRIVEFHRV